MKNCDINNMQEPPQALQDAYDRLSPDVQRYLGLLGLHNFISFYSDFISSNWSEKKI